MPFTTVTPDEWKMCCHVALDRHVSAVKKKLKDSVNKKRNWLDDFRFHVMGAVGELAASKVLGIPFSGSVDTFKEQPDLQDVEIRFRSNAEWQLILRDNDSDTARYVLARGLPPGAIEIVGWMYGKDGKRPEFKANHGNYREAYFVPDSMLRDIKELK